MYFCAQQHNAAHNMAHNIAHNMAHNMAHNIAHNTAHNMAHNMAHNNGTLSFSAVVLTAKSCIMAPLKPLAVGARRGEAC